MTTYAEFKNIIIKYNIDIPTFCNSAKINLQDIKEAEETDKLPNLIVLCLMSYIDKKQSKTTSNQIQKIQEKFFKRAKKFGFEIKNNEVIINPFNNYNKGTFEISDEELQFVTFKA